MKQRRWWTWVAGGIAAAALVVGSTWAWHSIEAQPMSMGGYNGGMMALRGMLHGLDLTADQKKQLAGILRAHKAELLQAQDGLRKTGRAMMEGLLDQGASPEALQAKVDAASDAHKQLAKAMIGIRQDVLGILTAKQKQKLTERSQRFLQHMEKHLSEHPQDPGRRLDQWIDRLSNS